MNTRSISRRFSCLFVLLAGACSSTSTSPPVGRPSACADGTRETATGCEPIVGAALTHDFPMQNVAPGEEQLGYCRSWTLDNDQPLWVSGVELHQTESSHHSNFVYVPDDLFAGEDGIWPCSARGYEFYTAVAAGGVLFAQSTQADHDVQQFPAGAAIPLPAHARIVSDIHLLNASMKEITGLARLTIYTAKAADVSVKLKGFHVEYDALSIPAHTSARFTAQCAIASDFTQTTGLPFAPKVYYLLPHTHTLATAFFARVLGGVNDGQTLLDLGGFNGEGRGKTFDPPVEMTGADGFVFGCQYDNTRDRTVGWGFGQDEMCELFGFADAGAFFNSRVNVANPQGTAGDVALLQGPCVNEVFMPN